MFKTANLSETINLTLDFELGHLYDQSFSNVGFFLQLYYDFLSWLRVKNVAKEFE